MKKYGKENFKREILEFAENADELNELERKYVTLNEVNDKMCYNMKTGGDKWQFSEESLKQMSESHKGKPGHPLSEEVRQKLSETNKGRTFSEEHKKKLSESHKGKHHSEETKQKISEANKGNEKLKYWTGKIFSDEHRQHISKANKGKHHGPTSKHSWNYGISLSEEIKTKMSASHKKSGTIEEVLWL